MPIYLIETKDKKNCIFQVTFSEFKKKFLLKVNTFYNIIQTTYTQAAFVIDKIHKNGAIVEN